jgi:hypothetical protein
MADVYIAQSLPDIIDDGWEPIAKAPVTNDKASGGKFAKVGLSPITSTSDTIVHQAFHQTGRQPPHRVTNTEARMIPSPEAPISNDRTAVVHHAHPQKIGGVIVERRVAPLCGAEVKFSAHGQPMTNDAQAGTIHHNHATIDAGEPTSSPDDHHPPVGTTVSNERNVSFVPSAPRRAPLDPRDATPSPAGAMNVSGDVFFGKNAGHVGATEVHMLPKQGKPFRPNGDISIGGGGDTTTMAGSEGISMSPGGQPINR